MIYKAFSKRINIRTPHMISTFPSMCTVLVLFFSACQLETDSINSDTEQNADNEVLALLQVEMIDSTILTTLPYHVHSTGIQGHTLVVEVSYSGGCTIHNFSLFYDGTIMKSAPPQVRLYLKHEYFGGHCVTDILDTLYFNINALSEIQGVYIRLWKYDGGLLNEKIWFHPEGADSPLPNYE